MITEDILDWVATLPKWQQKLSYALVEKKKVTEDELEEIYEIFKVEMFLTDGDLSSYDIQEQTYESEDSHDIKWRSVGNLHGVNKLKTGPVLNVSDGLTVVYGENGSGKSGYTRLLNNAFISRGDQEILHNIYSDNPEEVSADFQFSIDGTVEEYHFPEMKDAFPFKSIRNFDAKSASDDMNRESAIDFAPSELSFFDALLSACGDIQRKLDEERNTKKIDNPTLKYFTNEGKALEQMTALSSKTDIDGLKEMFAVTEDEKNKIDEVKTEKAGLIALDINRQISVITQVLDTLNKAAGKMNLFVQSISAENIEIYNEQIAFLKKSVLLQQTDGLSILENEGIESLGSPEWKQFISAAKKYYDAISQHDKCPLCGHKIDEKDLIFKYWKYLESDAEKNLKFANDTLKYTKDDLEKMDLTFLVSSSVQEQWLLENYKKETEEISLSFKKAEEIIKGLLEAIDGSASVNPIEFVMPDIQGLMSKIVEKRDGLNKDSVNKRISECEKIEQEYTDKTKVIDLIPTITSYVEYLKWDSIAEKSKIKTRSITTKQKELFEKYVTDDYLQAFEEECKKLNADFNVEIVSRGSNGQTLKKLQIRGTAPGKVLSEGEQRAISIANFLTEVRMDSRNVGIVLDDPVCSLDHKRRSLIVKRLLEEAKSRQVVVFTHEITFFMELKTEAEKNGVIFEQETIRNFCNEPGDISPLIPWLGMTVKDRTGKLKNDLQGIVALYNSGDTDSYYYKAKEWCELLRESWERAVEEILFNDAIQRYNPCVQTQRLKKAPFTQDLYAELEKGMTECSAWCHDQARAINGNNPTAEDLKGYIDCFEKYCKKYRRYF